MDDARENAISAAIKAWWKSDQAVEGSVRTTIDAFEAAMLEAGWKMVPEEPTPRPRDEVTS